MTKEMVAPKVAPVEAWASSKVLEEVGRWLTEPGYVIPWPELDPEVAGAEIARRILEAEDPLGGDGSTVSAEQVLGLSFRLTGAGFRPSDPASGAKEGGAYVILEGFTGDGEVVLASCGAGKVVAKTYALVAKGQLGRWVRIVKGDKRTKSGFEFLDLVAGLEPFPDA